METLNVTGTRDQEQFYKILDNLIRANKGSGGNWKRM